MSSGPGRPANVDKEKVKTAILKRKADIFIVQKLKEKTDDIWKQISEDLEGKLLPKSIYSKLCNVDLKKFVFGTSSSIPVPSEDTMNESLNSEVNNSSIDEENITFVIYAAKTGFEALLVEKKYNRREGTRIRPTSRTVFVSRKVYGKIGCLKKSGNQRK